MTIQVKKKTTTDVHQFFPRTTSISRSRHSLMTSQNQWIRNASGKLVILSLRYAVQLSKANVDNVILLMTNSVLLDNVL